MINRLSVVLPHHPRFNLRHMNTQNNATSTSASIITKSSSLKTMHKATPTIMTKASKLVRLIEDYQMNT